MDAEELAREAGISTRTIRTAQPSLILQDELARRRREQSREADRARTVAMADVERRSAEAGLRAVETEAKLLESSNPQVASLAVKAILDRVMRRPKR